MDYLFIIFLALAFFGYLYLISSKKDAVRLQKIQEEKLERETKPCSHGIHGAYNNFKLCAICTKIDEENKLKIQKVELERRKHLELEKSKSRALYENTMNNAHFIRNIDPFDFEKLILKLFELEGYRVESTPNSGDFGIDGFLYHGNELILLQCKRYKSSSSVGRPAFQKLYGNVCDYQNKHQELTISGLMVSTCSISKNAYTWIKDKPIKSYGINEIMELINKHIKVEDLLPKRYFRTNGMVLEYIPITDDIKNSKDYSMICPKCHKVLEFKHGRNGSYLACSSYPKCTYSESILGVKSSNYRRTY